MKTASKIMSFVAGGAASAPWGQSAERLAVRLGHMLPASRIVRSFCLHFGFHLLRRGEMVERVAALTSGGKMLLRLYPGTIQYYFLGTMCHSVEIPVERLLKIALREGDVFFDIGANVGFYTFFAAPLCGASGRVHAFEANPALRENLLRSIALNANPERISINSSAVGATHGGEIILYLPPGNTPDNPSGIPSTIPHEWLDSGLKVSVPLISVDGYMSEHKIARLDVVKIDIEGGEMNAFGGMLETFRNTPPALVICELMAASLSFTEGEYVKRASTAPAPAEIVEFMRAQGYQPWHIRPRDGKLDHVATADEIEGAVSATNVENVCFARPELRQTRPELYAAD
jgi:FkbM family methyltransferase